MERAIMLSLEKAKEFYAKGGEFRDLALGAYTEEELTKKELPKTWEEFCNNYPKQKHETYIGIFSTIELYDKISDRHHIQDKNVCPSQKSAEAHLAMIQLEQLRDCYRQGWTPDYDDDAPKYFIYIDCEGINVDTIYCESRFLTFQDKETAIKFSTRFPDLIKKAGDLI
jgi:hypothetical protein